MSTDPLMLPLGLEETATAPVDTEPVPVWMRIGPDPSPDEAPVAIVTCPL
jgi:hypothetical protein